MYIQDNYNPNLTSSLTFGGYNLNLTSGGTEDSITWYKTLSDSVWGLRLSDAKLGDESFRVTSDTLVEFNPGSPVIAMPAKDYRALANLYI